MENNKVPERLPLIKFCEEPVFRKEYPCKKHKVKHLWQIISPCKNWKKNGLVSKGKQKDLSGNEY